MRIILFIILATLPAIALGCEGECIVGITKAFTSKYASLIDTVFEEITQEVVTKLFPDRRYSSPPTYLMKPIISAYQQNAYTTLENDIFPSYFHGKCQRPDPDNPDEPPVNPPGCPNPDCPVVCGTPGSLVHFYSTLRFIVYSSTRRQLQAVAHPGTKPYRAVERKILSEAGYRGRRGNLSANLGGTRMPRQRRYEQYANSEFSKIMRRLPAILEEICGGNPTDSSDGLPKCSWENEMKEFILKYP
ncbi:hypothetical protein LshimejAT787_1102540 [Lyophyllum shimeji]|uniref:Uncharacterized protein n=1 Tax=Lyophyllum shimeji TaxID=47721 RepID=A0A9P3PVF7_LYOSH|nr:hypothetical protein LshimejAT787_1102540 [Lyophyllum shimeji]